MKLAWKQLIGILALIILAAPHDARASEIAPAKARRSRGAKDPDPRAVRSLKAEIQRLQEENERNHRQMEELARKVEALEAASQRPAQESSAPVADRNQLEQTVAARVEENLRAQESDSWSAQMHHYLGDHRFVITGSAEAGFYYDRQSGINTFAAQFEPLFLYRLNDWLLFEGEIEAKLPDDGESEFNLESAMAHVFLNDHAELVAGKWFVPFGDFDEDLDPFWINRFVSRPLPYREGDDGGMVPSSDIGVQVRGAFNWGATGQDVDYTVYASNGPTYDTSLPTPVVGQFFNFPNNIAISSHSKAFGTRVRVYPLPLTMEMGRLELGASTYDGNWGNGLWLTSWGVDFAYLFNEFEARGEYLQTYRDMPVQNADNRQGWYLQLGYTLSRLRLPYLDRTELLVRYAGQNQRAIVADEIPSAPGGDGSDVSPSTFVPHPREVALGLDYWFAPSIVWKLEYDIELPESGGSIINFDAAGTPVATPAHTPNDHALLTQLAIGF